MRQFEGGEETFVCAGCGRVEREIAATCPECGSVMRSERELVHRWVGSPGPNQGFMLNCRERSRVAFMDYEIANELPYCPFCRKEIEYRPRNLLGSEGAEL